MDTTPKRFHRRIGAYIVLALAVAIAPGCLTRAIWEHMGAEQWQRNVVSEQAVPTAMRVGIDRSDHAMALLDTGGFGVAGLNLRPAIHGHTGVELLLRPELFRVASASINGCLSKMGDGYDTNRAHLVVKGTVTPNAWRTFVTTDAIPPAARAALQLDVCPSTVGMSECLRRCGGWLQWPTMKTLLPELGADAELATFVFVDSENAVLKPDPSASPMRKATKYPECRADLQASTLYARFKTSMGDRRVRIDPDAFYVVFDLRPDRIDPNLVVHRSPWKFELTDSQTASGFTETTTVTASIWRGEVTPATTSTPTRIAQVVLTPFAMVADVIYTPFVYMVWLYVS